MVLHAHKPTCTATRVTNRARDRITRSETVNMYIWRVSNTAAAAAACWMDGWMHAQTTRTASYETTNGITMLEWSDTRIQLKVYYRCDSLRATLCLHNMPICDSVEIMWVRFARMMRASRSIYSNDAVVITTSQQRDCPFGETIRSACGWCWVRGVCVKANRQTRISRAIDAVVDDSQLNYKYSSLRCSN